MFEYISSLPCGHPSTRREKHTCVKLIDMYIASYLATVYAVKGKVPSMVINLFLCLSNGKQQSKIYYISYMTCSFNHYGK